MAPRRGTNIHKYAETHCPYCERRFPKGFKHPMVDPMQKPRMMAMDPSQRRFYMTLAESLESFKGFVKIPPPTKWSRWAGLFHICRAHHALNPERRTDEGWLCVVDMQAEWLMSVPPEFELPNLPTIEKTREVLKGLQRKITGYAKQAKPEFGEIAVRRQQGRIYIRHEGPVPELPRRAELEEKLDRIVTD